MLLWLSERRPQDWSFEIFRERPVLGAFPHLIGAELYASLCTLFDEHHEAVTGKTSEPLVSRVTGAPCPYVGDSGAALHCANTYYPTSASHAAVAEALLPFARAARERR